jgi:hypothetical protein
VKLKNIVFALAIGATAASATITTADAYYPSKYCQRHVCARPGHHWHCKWVHGKKRCWR